MSWEEYLVKPLPVVGGKVPPLRQELSALSDEEKFLYLEGLRRFQTLPGTNPLSYFQIAGIHGKPYGQWPSFDDPLTGKKFDTGIKQVASGGFCTHSSVLFLSWHRPYLALFESALYKHVNDVAKAIDGSGAVKAKYVELAQNFRIPYWDWAKRTEDHFPQIALSKSANAAFSKGFQPPTISGKPSEAIANNPLFSYTFPKGTQDDIRTCPARNGKFDPVTKEESTVPIAFETTVRYPVVKGDDSGRVIPRFDDFYKNEDLGWKRRRDPNDPNDKGERFQPGDLLEGMRPKERNLSERTAYLLKAYQRYGPVSYNAQPSKVGVPPPDAPDVTRAEVWGSFEDIHNTIHNYAGGGGHMSSVPTSAFDPIFWLHHTNIDRLFTIWQALHESNAADAYVEERPVPGATFAKPNGSKENKLTPLWPFRKSVQGSGDTVWWNSEDSRRTEPFGYSYPETVGWTYPGTDADRNTLIKKIDKLYTSMPQIAVKSMKRIVSAGEEILPHAALLKSFAEEKDTSFSAQDANITGQITLMQKIDEQLPSAETLVEQYSGPDQPYFRDLLDKDNSYNEWLINVKAQKHALGGQAVVHFFLGDPPPAELAQLWPYTPFHVGAFVTLGQDATTACENCQRGQAEGLQVTGQIPLTIALAERYANKTIPDFTDEVVEEYLSKNLHWRTILDDGTIIQNQTDLEGLLVYVVSNKVTISEDDDVPPIYDHEVKIHPRATTRFSGSGGFASAPTSQGAGSGTGLTVEGLAAFDRWRDDHSTTA